MKSVKSNVKVIESVNDCWNNTSNVTSDVCIIVHVNVWENSTINVCANVRTTVMFNVCDTIANKTYTDEQLKAAFCNVELL